MGNEIEDYLKNLIAKIRSTDEIMVGEKMAPSRIVLGKDERDARIKGAADRYLKGENIGVDEEAKNLDITKEDVIKELANREIKKILGNK